MKYYLVENGKVMTTAYKLEAARQEAEALSKSLCTWVSIYTKTTLKGAYDDGRKVEMTGKLSAAQMAVVTDYETPKYWYMLDGDPDVNFTGFSLLDLARHVENWQDGDGGRDDDTTPAAQDAPQESAQDTAADAPADAAQPAQDTAQDAPAEPQRPQPIKSAELHKIMHTWDTHVRYTGSVQRNYSCDGYKIAYGARFVVGAVYRIPEKYRKSRAADVIFRVDRNTGKSVSITVFERYNGKITETVCKNKPLNPGAHYFWMTVDPETGKAVRSYEMAEDVRAKMIDFSYFECIDITKISRWCVSGCIAVVNAEPVTPDDFRRFMAADAPAADAQPKPAAVPAAPAVLDFSPKYYAVSEKLAEMHKNAMSYFDYKPGTVTNEYRKQVDAVYKLAEISADPEKSLYLADIYSKRLARWYDDYNRNGASCPSVLVAGFSNFPTRKKERQNARADVLMQQWERIQHMKTKIAHPEKHEIRRQTITDEFENVLYFRTEINTDANRLQLIFDGKPAENVRAIMKNNGFRWSPRYMAWQRQLTENAVCAVWCVVDALDALENADADAAAAQAAQIAAQTNTAA